MAVQQDREIDRLEVVSNNKDVFEQELDILEDQGWKIKTTWTEGSDFFAFLVKPKKRIIGEM
ncbi:MAG: hypothetical protein A2358_03025 [Candidatus Staskawiczbacteria bacterium RIFOXYB1_FULL_37_44]|uniref:DUF4177 domain-containing protein n=1 Tax=Candidatus Staskawiczbacteria bacterium RIFOXYB1_FULL_37_44 TaxID=1802223 RepID=A0A1G2IX52_9BACT|nr:MAG: hypothetical protein A2358_03025 [Candidatus Staskawiczbacteria bacterium RIFOXYB1_FULL_37_44]OGZ89403.1 MAG: hypothetical protein A2581_00800 [Candidatus Staskawiczbacteria bacterium RIFOXYD1_FULL_37_110]